MNDQTKPVLEDKDFASAVRIGVAYDAPLYAFLNRTHATGRMHSWLEIGSWSDRVNVCQEFIRAVDIDRRNARVRETDEKDYQITKNAFKLALDIERALLRGKLCTGNGATTRLMRGLAERLTTNVTEVGGELTINEFEAFLRGIWESGGSPDVLLCDGLFLSVIHEWNVGSLQVAPSDSIGGVRVTQWVSPFCVFTLLPDRQVATGTCYALTSDDLALAVIDDIHYQQLSLTSDGSNGQVVAELTLECRCECHHGRIYGVRTST